MKKIKLFFSTHKKAIRISLIAILCALVALILCSDIVTVRKTSASFSSTISQEEIISYSGYAVDKNHFYITNNDPGLHIYAPSEAINDVCIKLDSPLEKATTFQIYYAKAGENLSEANSTRLTIEKGSTELYAPIPEGVYHRLRLDVDGEFELDCIVASMVSERTIYKSLDVNFVLLLILLILISAGLVYYVFFTEHAIAIFGKTRDRLFSSSLDVDYAKSQAVKVANTYAIIAFLTGCMLVFLMPPLTVADEQAHFLKTLMVSHFDFIPTSQNGSLGAFLTIDEANFLLKYDNVNDAGLSFPGLFNSSSSATFACQFFKSEFVTLNSFAYLVPGMAVALARVIFNNPDIYSLLIIARLANLVLGIIMVRHALKITPAFRNTMFLLALMPMTLHQCASTSYDALLICACFLLFAYIMKLLLSDKDYKISIKDIIIICLCLCVIFAAKIAYAIVIILFLAVSFKKFGGWKKYVLCIGLVGVCAGVFYLLPSYFNTIAFNNLSSVPDVASTGADKGAFEFSLGNISNVVSSTIDHFSLNWREQFFGVLGWLKIYLPKAFMELFYIVLTLAVITDACQVKGLKIFPRILSYVCLLGFTVAIILNAYIVWSPEINIANDPIAYGIQGRYFIPIIMFPLMIFSNPLLTKFKYRKQIIGVSYGVISITGIVCAMLTLFAITAFYWF